jgi:hypothetical protein
MSKHIQGFLMLLLLTVIFGCSGGATSGDPLGTDSIKVEASAASVGAGQESVITATVVRLNQLPATDRSVFFAFRTNNTGGTLRVVNDDVDGQGKAVAVYTAGSNSPVSNVADTIQVSLSTGAAAVVVITRSGTGRIFTLKANPTTLTANQSSVITATITDNKNSPVSGETISFSIPARNSGSPILTAYSGVSDSNGMVTTIYSPGIASPTNQVDDAVQASLADGSSRAVVITRSGTLGIFTIFTLIANPTTLTDNQSSVITATITDNKNSPVSGQTVSFSIPVRNTGSPTLTAYSGVSDGNGMVTTIYSPGTASPTNQVDDAVQASLADGSSRAVVITRSNSVSGAMDVSLSANPASVAAGQVSVIKATISGTQLLSNVSITFSTPVNNSQGSFIDVNGNSVSSITTKIENLGNVSVIYKSGAAAPGTNVQDTVQGVLSTGSTSAVTITRTAGGTGYVVTVTPTPSILTTQKGVSVITANVKDTLGVAYAGASVAFTVTSAMGVGAATVTSPATTDGNGNAIASYSSAHTAATSDIITASTTIAGVTYTGAAVVTVP